MTSMPRLLFVDDEQDLRDIAQEYFGTQYSVVTAENAAMAREIMPRFKPDVAILDIRMPGEDGLSLAKWLRENYPGLGIIMLTTAADVVDRIIGLEIGADDYIAKPFDLRELAARIKSVLRRIADRSEAKSKPSAGCKRIALGQCILDLREHRLYGTDGNEVAMTAMEYDLLKVFVEHPNKVLNRDQIMELAHHRDWDVYDRSIDLRIMRLRRKIEADPEKPGILKTVRGAGYMLVLA